MNRKEAEKITTEYLKPIFGFALKRCKNLQDAEDLSQEIVIKVFQTLCKRDNIENVNKFVWTIAHNALSNYYRDSKQNYIGTSIDEVAEILCDNRDDLAADTVLRETTARLQSEIAYLTKLQRRIVIAYYYESMKQSEIAQELKIPVGTVKWHLFEAKKELKRGMETMRTSSELKFNPIKLVKIGISGSVSVKGSPTDLLRSSLSQNIIYCVYRQAKSINQIADELGVSPVYVESEVDALEEYGHLIKTNDKYLCNVLLSEENEQIIRLEEQMYEKVSDIFANELFDKLQNSELLDDERIVVCNRMKEITDGIPVFEKDKNFMLWSLIPYIAACSGENLMNKTIEFEDAATLRPDGGQNICYATVYNPTITQPQYADYLKEWFGPCWNSDKNILLWQIDSIWSGKRIDVSTYQTDIARIIPLLNRFFEGETLSSTEYATLSEKGLLKVLDNKNGFWATSQAVWIRGEKAKKALLEIGDLIKEKHFAEFEELKKPYVEAVLNATPKHLKKAQQFCLQYIFSSDGLFILHCIKKLVDNGKLKLPTEEQKRALTTVIIHE